MNKGTLQNSMMMGATNPSSLWNINNLINKPPFSSSPPSSNSSSSTITNFLSPSPNYNIISPNNNSNHNINDNYFQVHPYNNINNMNMSTNSSTWLDYDEKFPESLSQLLLNGLLMGEEGKSMKKWEEQLGIIEYHHSIVDQVKQESSVNSYNNINNNNPNNNYNNNYNDNNNIFNTHQINNIPTSSPQSCVSTNFRDNLHPRHNLLSASDYSSECNSKITSSAQKKPKVQPSSSSPSTTFKVRKEKLGDRVTSLHQLVSPFGKTDTASVLLEAIGYIRFLHTQIEALSLPYLTNGAGDESQPDLNEEAKDLRSRGLCLVPLSCTMHVGTDNGADYWAPAIGGGGFRSTE
ncbi:hypothetical protein RND81_08G054800 [Saponaria officinalis]|uniref:BHLH domain-containing protein n=1 Tax=Saponaria officinalis TaxID=3572 RepID=A0AAW1J5F0_SAPOF